MDPLSNTSQQPVIIGLFGVKISPETQRQVQEQLKKRTAENRARLSPEEQRELAERDEWVASSAGFQQVGESGE